MMMLPILFLAGLLCSLDGIRSTEDFKLTVDGQEVRVHSARVFNWRNPDGMSHGIRYSTASFASFSCEQPVKVSVKCKKTPQKVTLRPLSYGLIPEVEDNVISFTISPGQKVTVEPHEDTDPVLHIFADRPEEKVPDPDDPNVIYFGPGVHETTGIELTSGQTLYLASGAVLKGVIGPDEKPRGTGKGHGKFELTHYPPLIYARNAKDISIRGRGILDGSELADQGARKSPILIDECENVQIEGITIKEGTSWNITLNSSDHCTVDNVKIISHFYNSDGINPVSSRDVIIRDCFLRQQDDGVAIKSMGKGAASNIHVSGLVMWSDWGFALGPTYEIREPVHDVVFEDCDIIHATHANKSQGVLGVLVTDSSTVSRVQFKNIRVERCLKPLIELTVLSTQWSATEHLGGIQDITFENITLMEGGPIPIRIRTAFRTNHLEEETKPILLLAEEEEGFIKNITFRNVLIRGRKLNEKQDIQTKGRVMNIVIR